MNDKTKNELENNHRVPFLPDALPFNEGQKQWLGGFMAGLHSRLLVTSDNQGAAAPAAAPAQKPLTIIYGSQTGNAESMAELAAEQAVSLGMKPVVMDMDDADIQQLARVERLLVVTSTYGEGEMPDNAEALWEAASADDAPSFANTFFSVLALGDTAYDGFCVAGKMWDERLAELGGQRVAERVDCDVDFEAPSQAWMDKALPEIAQKGTQGGGAEAEAEAAGTPASAPKKPKSKYNRQNPLLAELITKKVITGEGSSKEICHFELSLGDSGEQYEAGDAVYILPVNREDIVTEVLEALSARGDEKVAGSDKSLREVLTEDLEIRTPGKEFLAALSERADDSELTALVTGDDTEALADFLWGKDIVDLLAAYPAARFSVEEFVSLSRPLAGRAYSISSSLNKHENQVHVTIGSVRYHTNGRDHNGVCSTFLADVAQVGDKVQCYFAPNKNFAVPADKSLPIIMVGPGTGIAPFRAFLEEREVSAAGGDNWLFFGDRNASTDFIYEDELRAWQESGLLTRLDLAFSRDQKEKVYVQDRMLENGAEFYAWLEKGAYFYICGDAFRMAKDVDAALHKLIEQHGNKTADEAVEYVNALKKQKRYVRDVY
ncbi:MAG: sulfite reductase subunit alpha [Gammaproteobacteria bacterium]|nr:MAG: sulfite reductase subunit alpha [Pseudomonadota bacterium]PIE38648.1 MAG: sulfite reductase subunit alpha [Gammaproteobacteria bacterium]